MADPHSDRCAALGSDSKPIHLRHLGNSAQPHRHIGRDGLYGGLGNDTISGGDGIGFLFGDAGNDTITGGIDADVIDGGTGADTMTGGAGNDIFVVDNVGDVVNESGLTNGTDYVFSSVSTSLTGTAYAVDHGTLTGTANIDLAGNSLANRLTGNSGNNVLDGADGNDTLNGASRQRHADRRLGK